MEMMTTALGSVPTTEIRAAWKGSRSLFGPGVCLHVQELGGGTSGRIRSSCLSSEGYLGEHDYGPVGAANPVQAQRANPGGNPVPGFDLRDLSPLGLGWLANGVA